MKKKPKQLPASPKSTLDDLKLQPWTPDRIIAFQALGGIYPNTGRAGWEQLRSTGVYPGALRDTTLFVYLRTLEPQEVEDATWKDALAFAQKRGLHDPDGKAFWEAYPLFIRAQKEVSEAISIPKGGGEASDGDDEDPKD